jgi:UDP-glucuronate 4-epimerase
MDLVDAVETELGKKAEKNLRPMQAGDVVATWADTSALERDFGYRPKIDIGTGIARFILWYRNYYGLKDGEKAGTTK